MGWMWLRREEACRQARAEHEEMRQRNKGKAASGVDGGAELDVVVSGVS